MKKIFTVLLFLLLAFRFHSFASDLGGVPKQATESFEKEYPGALYAKWEALEEESTYAVRFVYKNESLVAYYKHDGSSLGLARMVTIDKVPAKVKEVLAKKYADHRMLTIQELTLQEQQLYYFELEGHDRRSFVGIDKDGHVRKSQPLQHL